MDIKFTSSLIKKRLVSSPKAGAAHPRKSLQIQGISGAGAGQCWPGHWPGQPGAVPREPKAIPGRSGARLGEPMGIADVADLIGCSPWTVRQTLIPRGLPYFRFTASGRLIFYRDQVVCWIEQQQQGGMKIS